jgi:hypothetical protein
MSLLRRFSVLVALLFWQGGGAFFAVVAIPVGRAVLHDQIYLQNRITRDATAWLNRIGLGVLALLAWDLAVDPSHRRRQLRLGLWLTLAATLAFLFLVHARLTHRFDPSGAGVADGVAFQIDHWLYLAMSVGQTLTAMALLAASLASWRMEDTMGIGGKPTSHSSRNA